MTDSRCIKGESKGELIELCYCCGMPSGNVIIVPLSRFPLSAARRVPLGIIGTHTFVNTIATAAISRASVIDAWLQDVVFACCRQDCASPKRRRSSSPASPTKRRRPLRPLVANALTMTSPSSDLAFDDEKTPRPRRRADPRASPLATSPLHSSSPPPTTWPRPRPRPRRPSRTLPNWRSPRTR